MIPYEQKNFTPKDKFCTSILGFFNNKKANKWKYLKSIKTNLVYKLKGIFLNDYGLIYAKQICVFE